MQVKLSCQLSFNSMQDARNVLPALQQPQGRVPGTRHGQGQGQGQGYVF